VNLEHPYYRPQPGTAWAEVDEWARLLPPGQPLITLANWQEAPNHYWAFQHMGELMPSHVIEGTDSPRSLPEHPVGLGDLPVELVGGTTTVDDVIATTETDGWLVIHRGEIVHERYLGSLVPRRRHLLMSVTKSVISCAAASLAADGLLDPEAPVETYVPELAGCGYADASVRTVLDMRSGIVFRETYLDAASEVRVMERSMGWAPRNHGDPLGMYPYILTVRGEQPHGGVFVYRSIDTDVLGWICERAAGRRMADLISERIWQPSGAFHDAQITADPLGTAVHDGGMSATLRDVGRFGQMLLDGGRVGERSVVPGWWLDTAFAPPPDVREAFARSESEPFLPGGWYRNQFWFVPGDSGPILLCLGIHGQLVYVEPSTATVGVKLSSWPVPQDPARLTATVAAFRAVARSLR